MLRRFATWMFVSGMTLAAAIALTIAGAGLVALTGCGSGAGANHGGGAATTAVPTDDELKAHLDKVIEQDFRHRRLDIKTQAAWQVLHSVVAYGRSTLMYEYEDRCVRAVDYCLAGGRMAGWDLRPGDTLANGRQGVRAVLDPGSTTGQGHKDQWLGYIAISGCNLPREQVVRVGGRDFTIGDWVDQVKRDVHAGTEHGWTLMILAEYAPLDEKWTAGNGETWSIERVMALEAGRDLKDAACGGTHSLGGLTVALQKYVKAGGKVKNGDQYTTDGWGIAAKKIDECLQLVEEYQRPDGSLSADYFNRSTHATDLAHRLRTTGHTLEFLALTLSKEELAQPWIARAVEQMCQVLDATKSQDIECGALYHGMHGLVRYRIKRFGPIDVESWAKDELATAAKREPKAN